MTEGQKKRAAYFRRTAAQIAKEAVNNHGENRYDRVVRKTQEASELLLKARILDSGAEPTKTHDLVDLAAILPTSCEVTRGDLEFLSSERIPSFYGADDFIPDEEYDADDSKRCLRILKAFKLIK